MIASVVSIILVTFRAVHLTIVSARKNAAGGEKVRRHSKKVSEGRELHGNLNAAIRLRTPIRAGLLRKRDGTTRMFCRSSQISGSFRSSSRPFTTMIITVR